MDSLTQIPGVGPKTLLKLKKLGIGQPSQLVYHIPHRYIDFSQYRPIRDAVANENITVRGVVLDFQNIYTRFHKNIQKAVIADKTGKITLIWFNQPYLEKIIKPKSTFSFAGTVSLYQGRPTMMAPEYGQYNTGKIIAIYPETQGLSSKWFRKNIQIFLDELLGTIDRDLPQNVLEHFHLMPLRNALVQVHNPSDNKLLEAARLRLALDEILSLQAQSYLNKRRWLEKSPRYVLKATPKVNLIINNFIKDLPFTLTPDQLRVWQEVEADLLSASTPTNRLLQGDVGSGKTIIAILACFLASLNHRLSLLIAPTEILAQQHHKTISQLLGPGVPLFLLTANSKIDFKHIPKNAIIVSTHAALFKKHELQDKVAVLVLDEQHKFGVKQRSFLASPNNPPHCLTMTATPIPRTVSLTMLGSLQLSSIEHLPKNRLSVKTFLVPKAKIADCYQWIDKQIQTEHDQAFIVCPFIDISESMASVKSAIKEYEYLSNEIFPHLKLALIHGKLKSKDREKIITDFKDNKINILVSTPIIEVGIDIPNANIIVIQSADRFGLAQLHQLRGRVGRGHRQSYCYLLTESDNEKARSRLEFLQQNSSGLKIAEFDMKNRGPGEAFSTLQHGFPSFKLASMTDLKLISLSQQVLEFILKNNPKFNLSCLIQSSTNFDTTIAAN